MLEKGVIDDAVFETIHGALPPESSLSGPLQRAGGNKASSPAPAAAASAPTPAPATRAASPPTQALQNLAVKEKAPGPPSYDDTPAPGVPVRSGKPVIAHARALYRYTASDDRDVSFERDDKIVVHEHMNQDWWMGRNLRTGQEGIFPRNYVLVEADFKGPPQPMAYGQPQYPYAAYQAPPPQQNPYNSNVPPMAVAEGSQPAQQQAPEGENKMGEYGKKFGKKLGNAAIFGAGATIGGNLVNSIF